MSGQNTPKQSSLLTFVSTIAKQFVVVYLLLVVLLYFGQSFVIFPGAFIGGSSSIALPSFIQLRNLDRGDNHQFRIAVATPKKPRGVMVFFGGNGENFDVLIQRCGQFVKYNVIVVVAEPPGWGDSPGPLNADSQLHVAEKAAEYAQEIARKENLYLIVAGSSLGSFSAVHVISLGIGNKLLLHAPITSLVDVAAFFVLVFSGPILSKSRIQV